jgi:hypothetical protein
MMFWGYSLFDGTDDFVAVPPTTDFFLCLCVLFTLYRSADQCWQFLRLVHCDTARRAEAMDMLTALLSTRGMRVINLNVHSKSNDNVNGETNDLSQLETAPHPENQVPVGQDHRVSLDLSCPVNVLNWLIMRRLVSEFANIPRKRLDMFLVVFSLYGLAASAVLLLQSSSFQENLRNLPSNKHQVMALAVFDIFVLSCYVTWSMHSAIRINDRVFKQSWALLRQQMNMKENVSCSQDSTKSIELVIEMLKNEDDVNAAKILGMKANFGLVGTFVSLMATGITSTISFLFSEAGTR